MKESLTHRIYAREKHEKRFSPLDVKNGRKVVNLFYATCFAEQEANKVIEELREQNPEWKFQLRKI